MAPFLGSSTKKAMPALTTPPTVTAVSSAPQRRFLVKLTCCMRESLLSSFDSGSFLLAVAPSCTRHTASAMQSRSGRSPAFWSDLGGTPYWATAAAVALRTRAGVALFSERVLVNDQTISSVDV